MEKDKDKNVYECTICLENAKEPVVTRCGHIFCWPCIYSWLESKGASAKCPNCKNPISKETLIPIYTREENEKNTKKFKIPERPKGERAQSTNDDSSNTGGFGNFSFGSFGFFPFMGGFSMNFGGNGTNGFQYATNNTNRANVPSPFDSLPDNVKKGLINLLILLMMIMFYYQLTI